MKQISVENMWIAYVRLLKQNVQATFFAMGNLQAIKEKIFSGNAWYTSLAIFYLLFLSLKQTWLILDVVYARRVRECVHHMTVWHDVNEINSAFHRLDLATCSYA